MDLLSSILSELPAASSRNAYAESWRRWRNPGGGPHELVNFVRLEVSQLKAVKERLMSKFAPSTVKRCFIVAHRVWKSLSETEKLADPFQRVKVAVPDNVPDWNVLQAGELRLLADKLDDGTSRLERAVVIALGKQGWREHVLCDLKWSDVHQDEKGWYAQFKTKRKKLRRQRIHSEVMAAVKTWCEGGGKRTPERPFIPWHDNSPLTRMRIYRIVTRACKKFLGRHVTPHGLRATFISDAIQRKGIEFARQQAGQEDIKTTQRYSRWVVVEDEESKL